MTSTRASTASAIHRRSASSTRLRTAMAAVGAGISRGSIRGSTHRLGLMGPGLGLRRESSMACVVGGSMWWRRSVLVGGPGCRFQGRRGRPTRILRRRCCQKRDWFLSLQACRPGPKHAGRTRTPPGGSMFDGGIRPGRPSRRIGPASVSGRMMRPTGVLQMSLEDGGFRRGVSDADVMICVPRQHLVSFGVGLNDFLSHCRQLRLFGK